METKFRTLLLLNVILTTAFLGYSRIEIQGQTQDPGWPRQKVLDGGKIVYYQPQVDNWTDYKQLDFRMAFTLTPTGGKPSVGAINASAVTDVDLDNRTVYLHNPTIKNTYFPGNDASTSANLDQLVRTFLSTGTAMTISLDRLVASSEKKSVPPSVPVRNDPPKIFVNYSPAMLVFVDGDPVMGKIKDTKLQFVVNSNFPLFLHDETKQFFVYTGKQWLTGPTLEGPWKSTATLPKDFSKVDKDPQWAGLASAIPPPPSPGPPPAVLYSQTPAEVILFRGQPVYTPISGTQLVYASNTDSDVFVDSGSRNYYYLAAGRWFRASSLQGPWTFATPDLPPDFKRIPMSSPASKVLSSVPGTEEAKDAVLIAQIPTTAIIDASSAAAKASVTYNGDPKFAPIAGTGLSYATNTNDKVIQVGNVYYLCLNGVWFNSASAQGPWVTAPSVPAEIYTIPPSSPVYNVTYVTQVTTSTGAIQASYTSGYYGAFVYGAAWGAVIACGSGYYYPPYFYYPAFGYPVYYPYAATFGVGAYYGYGAYGYARGVYGPYGGAIGYGGYNPYTGTYARGGTVYGPYGNASVGRAYNPYTGTYARGGSVSTPYGTRSGGAAYNARTGTGAITRQGSSAYGQWGTSVVSRGNQAVQTGRASDSQGTIAGARSTSGAAAVGGSGQYGSGGLARTSGGDMYAAKDGNVYRNTGGGWHSFDNGGWNSARPSEDLNSEFMDRQRGAFQSRGFQRAQSFGGFGGGGFGGRFGGGGFGGFGGRRR